MSGLVENTVHEQIGDINAVFVNGHHRYVIHGTTIFWQLHATRCGKANVVPAAPFLVLAGVGQ